MAGGLPISCTYGAVREQANQAESLKSLTPCRAGQVGQRPMKQNNEQPKGASGKVAKSDDICTHRKYPVNFHGVNSTQIERLFAIFWAVCLSFTP
jgi:hypothetical protein